MDSLLAELWAHGYQVLFVMVLLETFGVPVPSAVALFVAGAAAAHGVFHIPATLACGLGCYAARRFANVRPRPQYGVVAARRFFAVCHSTRSRAFCVRPTPSTNAAVHC